MNFTISATTISDFSIYGEICSAVALFSDCSRSVVVIAVLVVVVVVIILLVIIVCNSHSNI